MPTLHFRSSTFWIVLFCLALTAACRNEGGGNHDGSSSTASEGSDTTAKEVPRLSLELRAQIGTPSDSLLFGELVGVDVNSNGRIFVGDFQSSRIYVIGPEGRLLQSVGRQGQGPGEFGVLSSVDVGPSDTLFTYDIQQRRLTAFAPPTYETAYVESLKTLPNVGESIGLPEAIYPRSDGTFLVKYAEPNTPSRSKNRTRKAGLARLDRSGTYVDRTVLSMPRRESFYAKSKQGVSYFTSMPFGRKPVVAVGASDRLFFGWSDSLSVGVYGAGGTLRRRIRHTVPDRRLSEETTDAFLRQLEMPFSRPSIRERTTFPDSWPAFFDLVPDDDGHLWVQIDTGRRNGESVWWIFDVESGRRVASASLHGSVDLECVRNDAAYAIKTTDEGHRTVVKYHITNEAGI